MSLKYMHKDRHRFAGGKWRLWMPHITVVLWLLYLWAMVWHRVDISAQTPGYDPLSYLVKAKQFWEAVGRGKIFNPLNIEPVVRPPGTVLISYPFGFSPDYQGFLFRSVFMPVLLLVGAVYLGAGAVRHKLHGWGVAAVAFLFSSLPMFYAFEWREDVPAASFWGLVDSFQAGVAALAVAALVRSLSTRSVRWLLAGSGLAALTLFIKPSGLMVMALVAMLWGIVLALELLLTPRPWSHRPGLRRYFLWGVCILATVFLSAGALCVFSNYFSRKNFAEARLALAVMRDVLQIPFREILLLFHRSSGEAAVVWVIAVGVLFVKGFRASRGSIADSPTRVRALALAVVAPIIWGLGAWYWLVVQAGGSQIRYFFPFLLMGMVCLVPAALLEWSHCSRRTRALLMAICAAPALNLAALLAAGDTPSATWQKLSGVNISVGRSHEEVTQAYALIGELRHAGRSAVVYSFSNGVIPAIFENVGVYERIVRPELPVFSSANPFDWLHGFVIRTSTLLDCDYVLARKYDAALVERYLSPGRLYSYAAESFAFEAFLSTLDRQSGVETVSEGQVLRLLRIVDRVALGKAIAAFTAVRSWRPEFEAANHPVWWNAESLAATGKKLAAKDIDFGDKFRLHALSFHLADGVLTVEAWWESLHPLDGNNDYWLFFHVLGPSGKDIVANGQIPLFPYAPLDEKNRWRQNTTSLSINLSNEGSALLGFGVYHPNLGALRADKGRTDNDGKRVLLPIADP